jgi:DnaK suppressor protein
MDSADSETASDLSPRELAILRERLERTRDELQARLRREEGTALQAESLTEPMDAAEQTREQDDAVVLAHRDRALLEEVERGLAKFETGTYGRSELSGEPIGFRRLQAIPWARVTAEEADEEAEAS